MQDMGVRLSTPKQALDAFFEKANKILFDAIYNCLAKLGEECVAKIRDRSAEESWIDHTGNLRSSVGYAVYDDGRKLIESAFKVVRDGNEGSSEGKKYIDSLTQEYSDTFALVVVAAMNYAEYVEAKDNKDVLASTKLWAMAEIEKRMKTALSYAEDKINKIVL